MYVCVILGGSPSHDSLAGDALRDRHKHVTSRPFSEVYEEVPETADNVPDVLQSSTTKQVYAQVREMHCQMQE